MIGNRREIPIPIRDLLITDWEDKGSGPKSYGFLAEKYKLKRSTVYSIIKRYKNSGTVENQPRSGRPRSLTVRESRELVREVKRNPFTSSLKLKKKVQDEFGKDVGRTTIRRYLKREGYSGRIARKKPFISKVNRRKRLNFARQHVDKPLEFWKKVLWTDETKINLFGSDRGSFVWRKKNEALKPRNLIPTVKHGGGSIMVWGSMAYDGVGNLEFIDVKMNADAYIAILDRNMLESARKLNLGRRFYFQQDNDPKHTSKKAREFLLKMKVNQLEWPPQSPDLNPIEHLWDILKNAVYSAASSNIKGLKIRVREAWEGLSCDNTKRLVESMSRRLQAVIAANGGPTKY